MKLRHSYIVEYDRCIKALTIHLTLNTYVKTKVNTLL